MVKKILIILKKIIMSAFLLYAYNLMAQPLNLIIPINIFTVLLVSILGIPAIFALIVILLLVY